MSPFPCWCSLHSYKSFKRQAESKSCESGKEDEERERRRLRAQAGVTAGIAWHNRDDLPLECSLWLHRQLATELDVDSTLLCRVMGMRGCASALGA